MPGGVNLHIRTRSSRSTRVLPLEGVSIRVGRGRQCEVQLLEPGLAEIQCLLRRRGDTWHVQPIGRNHSLALGGRPLDGPRPFPLGIPLRVGEHYLTLTPRQPVAPADAPRLIGESLDDADVYLIESEPEPLEPRNFEPPPAGDPPPPPSASLLECPPPASDPEPRDPPSLSSWRNRLDQRDRWIEDRKRESLWEARWKALGASRRAAAEARAAAPTLHTPDRPTVPPPPVSPPRPRLRPASTLPIDPLPLSSRTRRLQNQTPGPARPTAPPRILRPSAAPEPPRSPSLAELLPPIQLCLPAPDSPLLGSLEEANAAPPEARQTRRPTPSLPVAPDLLPPLPAHPMLEHRPASISLEVVDPTASWSMPPDEAPSPSPMSLEAEATLELAERLGVPVLRLGEITSVLLGKPTSDAWTPTSEADWTVRSPLGTPPTESPCQTLPDPIPDEPSVEPLADRVPDLAIEASAATDPALVEPIPPRAAHESARDARVGQTKPADTPKAPIEPVSSVDSAPVDVSLPAARIEPPRQEDSPGWSRSKREAGWPSAASILAARPTAAPSSAPSNRARRSSDRWPMPTEARPPAHWSVPGAAWYCIPAALCCLLLGGAAASLAARWATNDRHAGILADRLARLHGVQKPDPRDLDRLAELEAEMPDPSWTRSTSGEVAVRIAALARSGLDPVREERVALLLDAGRHMAPAQPTVRFALAWRDSQAVGPEGAPLGSRLGLSRDVPTLTWSARQLLEAGQTDRALALYHQALDLAGKAELEHLDRPQYSDLPQVRRFEMPYESLVSLVLRDLIDARRWTYEEWSPALTEFAVVPLHAARLLRERGSPDAERALERAIALASQPAPDGCLAAVHRAAGAEALALAGRWSEAEAAYREALDELGKASGPLQAWLARCWSFNLADLYARMGEPGREKEARRIALGNAPNDDITRLILQAQIQDGVALYDRQTSRASTSPSAVYRTTNP